MIVKSTAHSHMHGISERGKLNNNAHLQEEKEALQKAYDEVKKQVVLLEQELENMKASLDSAINDKQSMEMVTLALKLAKISTIELP